MFQLPGWDKSIRQARQRHYWQVVTMVVKVAENEG